MPIPDHPMPQVDWGEVLASTDTALTVLEASVDIEAAREDSPEFPHSEYNGALAAVHEFRRIIALLNSG